MRDNVKPASYTSTVAFTRLGHPTPPEVPLVGTLGPTAAGHTALVTALLRHTVGQRVRRLGARDLLLLT